MRDLWRKNLVQIQRLTALERDAARLEGERGQLIAATAQAKGKISEIELQILQIDHDLRSEVAKDLREVQGKIAELVERKVAAEDQLKRIDIRAPQNGMVHQSTVHTVGGVITPGETIMLIVPGSRRADGRGETRTAGHRSGSRRPERGAALLGLRPAHDARTQRRRQSRLGGPLHRPAHRRRLLSRAHHLPRSRDRPPRGLRLVPGMPVESFIRTGERTVLSYVTKPFADQAMRAFRAP